MATPVGVRYILPAFGSFIVKVMRRESLPRTKLPKLADSIHVFWNVACCESISPELSGCE